MKQRVTPEQLAQLSATPELDKMRAVTDVSQRIGEFLDWLRADQHIHLMVWRTFTEPNRCFNCAGVGTTLTDGAVCQRCGGTGNGKGTHEVESWDEDRRTINQLLADFFDIDLDKIEAERRVILDSLGGQ